TKASWGLLSVLILGASASAAVIVLLHYPVLVILSTRVVDLRISGLIAALCLFAAPSVFLGAVSPMAVRLSLNDLQHSGSAVGRLYALSTIGSLLGTFGCGFFVFAYLPTTTAILLFSTALFIASLIADPASKLPAKILLGIVIAVLFFYNHSIRRHLQASGIVDVDTPYQRAFVLTQQDAAAQRTYRLLVTDMLGSQSMVYLDAPETLAGHYTAYYELVKYFSPGFKKIAVLGGGAYTVPKYFAANYPDVQIDVVEIDAGFTKVARDYFFLKDRANLRIFHEDARTWLRRTAGGYDAVFIDAFQSSPAVPFHLTTHEAFADVLRILDKDGVVLMNIICAVEGKEGRFLRAEYAVMKSLFADVRLYAVTAPPNIPASGHTVQNLMLAALKNPLADETTAPPGELRQLLLNEWKKPISADMPLLTDNFAPVDYYMLPAYLKWQQQIRTGAAKPPA
ncbi:MAG TPA: fused MFS/spermidine synthase, partial [Oligoflexia bacterium]|nr:fused MFS/spermidine synthase [Oligoflexia bacterium]